MPSIREQVLVALLTRHDYIVNIARWLFIIGDRQ